MEWKETALPGVLIIEPDVYGDSRGFFLETYSRSRYASLPGLNIEFLQDNHSRSRKGVLRGLHLQRRHPQGKLVSVTRGSVWDVAVDVNPASSTFRQWVGVELSDTNHRQFYIPPGYAHGFCVLSDTVDFFYKCTDFYHPEDEVGLLWCDAELGIDWPITQPALSQRDSENKTLHEFLEL